MMHNFRLSQQSRDYNTVVSLGETILRRGNSPNLNVARALARTLTELGDLTRATQYWTLLFRENGLDLEARFHMTKSIGLSAVKIIDQEQNTLSSEQRDAINNRVRQALEVEDRNRRVTANVIVISGVSFCGSTLFDRILGSLPDVKSIGESHWLTKSYVNRKAEQIDFSRNDLTGVPQCSVCGSTCETLSMDFRAALSADRTCWYQKIADRLGTQHLIAADKNAAKLVENDPLLRMSCIVLFKSPVQAWLSHRNKLKQDESPGFYLEQLDKYLLVWDRSYRTFLFDFNPQGKMVYVSFEKFLDSPTAQLERLTRKVELPFSAEALHTARRGHAIGGNANAMKRLRSADYNIQIESLPAPTLPQAELQVIEHHAQTKNTYCELLSRSCEN